MTIERWTAMQNDVALWALANFGEQDPVLCLLGIIEEMGELEDAIYKGTQADIRDAVSDIMIYMMDYTAREEVKAAEGQVMPQYFLRVVSEPRQNPTRSLMFWAGQLAHCKLKWAQQIRGLNVNDVICALQGIYGLLNSIATVQGFDVFDVTHETWTRIVSKRDWKKNPENGDGDKG